MSVPRHRPIPPGSTGRSVICGDPRRRQQAVPSSALTPDYLQSSGGSYFSPAARFHRRCARRTNGYCVQRFIVGCGFCQSAVTRLFRVMVHLYKRSTGLTGSCSVSLYVCPSSRDVHSPLTNDAYCIPPNFNIIFTIYIP